MSDSVARLTSCHDTPIARARDGAASARRGPRAPGAGPRRCQRETRRRSSGIPKTPFPRIVGGRGGHAQKRRVGERGTQPGPQEYRRGHRKPVGGPDGQAVEQLQQSGHEQRDREPAEIVGDRNPVRAGQSRPSGAPGPLSRGDHLRIQEKIPADRAQRRHRNPQAGTGIQARGHRPHRIQPARPGQRHQQRHIRERRAQPLVRVVVAAERESGCGADDLGYQPEARNDQQESGRVTRSPRHGRVRERGERGQDHHRRGHPIPADAGRQGVGDLRQDQQDRRDPRQLAAHSRPGSADARAMR